MGGLGSEILVHCKQKVLVWRFSGQARIPCAGIPAIRTCLVRAFERKEGIRAVQISLVKRIWNTFGAGNLESRESDMQILLK